MFNKPSWKVEDWEEFIENSLSSPQEGDRELINDYLKYIDNMCRVRDLTEQEKRFKEAHEKHMVRVRHTL